MAVYTLEVGKRTSEAILAVWSGQTEVVTTEVGDVIGSKVQVTSKEWTAAR